MNIALHLFWNRSNHKFDFIEEHSLHHLAFDFSTQPLRILQQAAARSCVPVCVAHSDFVSWSKDLVAVGRRIPRLFAAARSVI